MGPVVCSDTFFKAAVRLLKMKLLRENLFCRHRSRRTCNTPMTSLAERAKIPQIQQLPCTDKTSSCRGVFLRLASAPLLSLPSSFLAPRVSFASPSRFFSSASSRYRTTPFSSAGVQPHSTSSLPTDAPSPPPSSPLRYSSPSARLPPSHTHNEPAPHASSSCHYRNDYPSRLLLSRLSFSSSSSLGRGTSPVCCDSSFAPSDRPSSSVRLGRRTFSSLSSTYPSSRSPPFCLPRNSSHALSSVKALPALLKFSHHLPRRSSGRPSSSSTCCQSHRVSLSQRFFHCLASSSPWLIRSASPSKLRQKEVAKSISCLHTKPQQEMKDTEKDDAQTEAEGESSLLFSRYANLRKEDRDKLVAQKMAEKRRVRVRMGIRGEALSLSCSVCTPNQVSHGPHLSFSWRPPEAVCGLHFSAFCLLFTKFSSCCFSF